jgi:hypothetical protein
MKERDGAVELLLNFRAARDGKRYGAKFFRDGVVVGFLRGGREWDKEEQGGEERLRYRNHRASMDRKLRGISE